MDSMRSLNTSLPPAHSSRPVPPEQLLQAFKTAALSVTNLYKSAVIDQNSTRAAGYQDALDDLLRFLDSENLGLQDGEGWRIRQWATERYDHTATHTSAEMEEGGRATTVSGREDVAEDQDLASSDVRATEGLSEPDQPERASSERERRQRHDSAPPIFRFTAGSSDLNSDDMQVMDETDPSHVQAEASSPPQIQVQVINRANRAGHRSTNLRHGRPLNRTPATVSGAKRKLQQLPDFFDISNLHFKDNSEDGAGSKRSRLA